MGRFAMIEELLQLWLDQALATCKQRWWLGGIAVASITCACLVITVGAASTRGIVIVVAVTTASAILAVAGSGTHHGSITIALVALAWLGFVGDVTTPRAIVVASCLYSFHVLLALMAATRHTSPLDHRILLRWAARSVVVLATTVAVWLCVVAVDGQIRSGSAELTFAGLIVVAAGAVALRREVLGAPRPRSHDQEYAID